jgi:hypothetical protein
MENEPHDHHYAPQFFLRNFAVDPEKKKIMTVAKHGSRAVWARRSIASIGHARDLYVHIERGVPISVERSINTRVETPISKSDTWAKIVNGCTDALDKSDKPVLYALIRHLEVRTPHYRSGIAELAELVATPNSDHRFTDEEREMYAALRADPNLAKMMLNMMSTSSAWTAQQYAGSGLCVLRSPIPLRSSTTPVMAVSAPAHPALYLPLPGMVPYQLILTLSPTAMASLVLANFEDGFMNVEIDVPTARGFNRHFTGQFAYFENTKHLITGRDDLIADMTWAPYDVVEETERKIAFRRREEVSAPSGARPKAGGVCAIMRRLSRLRSTALYVDQRVARLN